MKNAPPAGSETALGSLGPTRHRVPVSNHERSDSGITAGEQSRLVGRTELDAQGGLTVGQLDEFGVRWQVRPTLRPRLLQVGGERGGTGLAGRVDDGDLPVRERRSRPGVTERADVNWTLGEQRGQRDQEAGIDLPGLDLAGAPLTDAEAVAQQLRAG